jgi:hypothetical protein
MADDIAKIVLSAEDQTSAVFRSVTSRLKALGTAASNIGPDFAGIGAQIAGVLSGTALAGFVKTVASGLDALNDLSDATGSSVENLSALEDVAERTGTSFDTVGTALVKFNAALKDAKPGSDVANILQRIGLSAAELKKQDPAEALRQVAVALDGYGDKANVARAVQELFGKSLREVAPLLADLAKQGSLVAKVTTEQALAAERFQHALDNLAKNSKDAARSLVGDLLPALTRVLDSFNKFGGLGGTAKAVIGQDDMSRLGKLAKEQSVELNRLNEALSANQSIIDNPKTGAAQRAGAERRLEQIRNKLREVSAQALATTDAIKGVADKMAPNNVLKGIEDRGFTPDAKTLGDFAPNEALQKYIKTLNDAIQSVRNLNAEEKAHHDILSGSLGKLTKQQEERLLALARSLDKLKGKFALDTPQASFRRSELEAQGDVEKQFATDKLDKFIAAQKELQSILAETSQGQVNDLTKQYSTLQTAFDKGAISAQQYADGLDVLDEKFAKLTAPVQQAAEKISEFAQQAQRNIQDALGDSLVQLLEGKFSSIGKIWGDLLRRMIAQALAAKLNEKLFGDNLGGGLLGPALTAVFGGFKAGGGPVEAGKSYVVGEQGPELFTPPTSGTITPNGALGGAGVTVIQHINVGSGVNRNDVMLAMNAAKNAAVAEVGDAARRARSFA